MKFNFKQIQGRVTSAAGLVAGSVASNYLGTTIDNVGKGKISPLANAGIRLLVAAALPSVIGGKAKAGFITDVSNGMMAQAGVAVAKAMNIPGISGTEMDSPISDWVAEGAVNGLNDSPISGAAN